MDEAGFRKLISGETTGLPAAGLRGGLRILSWMYAAGTVARNQLFDQGIKRQNRVAVPVISVGNITTGGTGKTPVVAYLANWFAATGKRPVILSRGYRSLPDAVNDEKLVLDQLCPGVPHLQNPDRVAAARQAIRELHPDVFILDDGFQHRRVARDLNLALIDATNPWGYGYLLPRGLLRESRRGLRRADLILVTRINQVDESTRRQLREELQVLVPGTPVAEVAFQPTQLRNSGGRTAPLIPVGTSSVGAFCGIGNPESFFQSVRQLGFALDWQQAFPDHHHYTAEDLHRLGLIARERSLTMLLTTQKDLVKIRQPELHGCALWAVEIGACFERGEELLTGRLESISKFSRGGAPG